MKMPIIDEFGRMSLEPQTLKPQTSDHPVYKARVALEHRKGKWLYAPEKGHTLDRFKTAKGTEQVKDEFEKHLKFYLSTYGADTIARLSERGVIGLNLKISKGALSG